MTQTELKTTLQSQVKRFTLSDSEGVTKIAFFPQAPLPTLPGSARLDYRGLEGGFTFVGDDIAQQQSPLGLLITVILEPDVDAGELALTLILPPVNLAGQKQQDFATVAIKTRSLGFVVDRSGAQLKYRVLSLTGVADGVLLPPISNQRSSDLTQQSVTVTAVNLTLLESHPPQLQIIARGTVPSTGWTNPQLIPLVYVQAPPDCIYDFEFVATPPTDPAAQVITPIVAKYRFPAQGLRGVRVNGIKALLNRDLSDCGMAEI
ncbi:MAG: hypothetical protein KME13_15670 [Myxacorys californica WJT36-NPBG1]|jgi:hypothetical protein|nr:hypothetical protein [Myxacorys californica WJT36-NPBG1]